jgi:LPXTG-motif cell wall-anchored protein
MPFFRTNFWPVAAGVGAVALALLLSKKKTQGGKT